MTYTPTPKTIGDIKYVPVYTSNPMSCNGCAAAGLPSLCDELNSEYPMCQDWVYSAHKMSTLGKLVRFFRK